jgi:hypothetical protein
MMDLNTVKAGDTFILKSGNWFEFRYISHDSYGFVFGLLEGRGVYLTKDDYEGAKFLFHKDL